MGTAKANEIAALAAIGFAQVGEFEFQQEALDALDVIGIMRREEQVDVDCRCFRGFDAQTQFDVGEDQADATQAPLPLLPNDLFVTLDAEVVGDAQRADWRVRCLDGAEKRLPRVRASLLVVQSRPGRMDVGIPTMPDRATFAVHIEFAGHQVSFMFFWQTNALAHATPAQSRSHGGCGIAAK